MKCTELNLITCAWTFYHSVITLLSDHTCFYYLSCEAYAKYTQHSDGVKFFWPLIVVARTPLPLVITSYTFLEVTSELVVLKGFWGQWHTANLPGCYGILLAVPGDTFCHAVLTRWLGKSFQKRVKITMDLKMMIDSYSWITNKKGFFRSYQR